MLASQSSVSQRVDASDAGLRRSFAAEGYLVLPGVVDAQPLAELQRELMGEFVRLRQSGRLFSGGGTVSGHLNCFPGASSRFVKHILEKRGVLDLVRALSPTPLREPHVGCNFNLPGSRQQNEHVDGDAGQPFLVLNVAVVKTDIANGAMEVLRRTHLERYKYWQLVLKEPERVRVCMEPGDVLIRTSNLWHRGMPNRSAAARPMLAFTWEEGGSDLSDPYELYGGRITFLPNRYGMDWKGRLRERAFAVAPRLGRGFLAARSLFDVS